MKLDVALLADIFESYHDISHKNYGLDPSHFYTAPSLSWEACLKITKVDIELIADPDMTIFINRGFLGGISMARTPLLKANNEFTQDFNEEQLKTFLLLIDANNLYGWAMLQKLPIGGFQWGDLNQFTPEKIMEMPDSDEGAMIEVDLAYPPHLHKLHAQYPLAPEQMIIKDEFLSEFQKKTRMENNIPASKSLKLCLTLFNKEKMVLHYKNLQQYVNLGMKILKVHKVLLFKQEAWMAPYILKNTEIRQNATDKITVNFAKLMNNSAFGKTCEDPMKYKKVRLIFDDADDDNDANGRKMQKLQNNPCFDRVKVYDSGYAAVLMMKQRVKLDKPRYIGMSILALSKTLMYDFHYNFILPNFPDAKLGFTDTDSFLYLLQSDEQIHSALKRLDVNERWFDFSNYPNDHPNFSLKNKLVPGKFKDETPGEHILEGVFLRSKMYSLICTNSKFDKTTAKGITTASKNLYLDHKSYRDALDGEHRSINMTRIVNESHKLYTVEQSKKGLCNYNDKIWLDKTDDGEFITKPFGFTTD